MALNIQYEEATDVVTIEGIKYVGELFRGIGFTFQLGRPFEIVRRGDGVVTVRHLDPQVEVKARLFDEWIEKTNWVQEQMSSFPVGALGRHRADVMRAEIDRLRALAAAK